MTFIFPNKKIKLVHNPNAVTAYMGNKNHDMSFMLTGTTCSWVLRQMESGRFPNPFTKGKEGEEERKALEEALGLNLDVNKVDNDFRNIRVKIKKSEPELENLYLELDLSTPLHYLWYIILKQQEDISPSWKDKDLSKKFRWILKEEDEVTEVGFNSTEMKSRAYQFYNTVKNSRIKMFDFLKVLGKRPEATASMQQLSKEIGMLIESDKRTLTHILEVIDDKDFDVKVFIEYAILSGVLKKEGIAYRLMIGGTNGDIIGKTTQDAIDYLKNPINSEVKEKLKSYVLLYKKEKGLS